MLMKAEQWRLKRVEWITVELVSVILKLKFWLIMFAHFAVSSHFSHNYCSYSEHSKQYSKPSSSHFMHAFHGMLLWSQNILSQIFSPNPSLDVHAVPIMRHEFLILVLFVSLPSTYSKFINNI